MSDETEVEMTPLPRPVLSRKRVAALASFGLRVSTRPMPRQVLDNGYGRYRLLPLTQPGFKQSTMTYYPDFDMFSFGAASRTLSAYIAYKHGDEDMSAPIYGGVYSMRVFLRRLLHVAELLAIAAPEQRQQLGLPLALYVTELNQGAGRVVSDNTYEELNFVKRTMAECQSIAGWSINHPTALAKLWGQGVPLDMLKLAVERGVSPALIRDMLGSRQQKN